MDLAKVDNKNSNDDGRDEVDFVPTKEICVPCSKNSSSTPNTSFNPLKKGFLNNIRNNQPKSQQTSTKTSVYGDCELQTAVKSHISHLFHFPLRKKSESDEKSQQKPRLIKSSSIARLFGNSYSTATKKSSDNPPPFKKSHSVSEKFTNRESDEEFVLRVSDLSASTTSLMIDGGVTMEKPVNGNKIKTITKGLGKLLRRNHSSVEISPPDPEYKVLYLGNVLTGWAKGDECVEKPLATLWRNYTQNNRPEVLMRLRVCPSGLKATTRQHGLTEYWSHRITFCSAPKSYPKIFCWIYRHEGRKLKHELRCHAVICSKEVFCQEIANVLKQNLAIALREFKRDKINKQNARLSLANAADENPSMPRRKIMLSTGANNYRPPLERSKSAPKLFSIEELVDEEEDDEENLDEEARAKKLEEKRKRDEMKTCCKDDHLYPSVTLGRRRCRRGHSIRKSRLLRGSILNQQNSYPPSNPKNEPKMEIESEPKVEYKPNVNEEKPIQDNSQALIKPLGSDEDFENFLLHNDYDSKEPLSSDLMSYFDMKLTQPTSLITTTTASLSDLLNDDLLRQNQRTCMSMSDLVDYQSDNELDNDNESDIYFNQDSLLDTLRRQSATVKVAEKDEIDASQFIHENKHDDDDYTMKPTQSNEFLFGHVRPPIEFDDDLTSESPSSLCMSEKTICVNLDSDEGSSISSGCETSSTVTTNAEEGHLPRRGSVLDRVRTFEQLAESQAKALSERGSSGKFYSRSNSISSGSRSFILAQESKVTRNGTLTRSDVDGNVNMPKVIRLEDDSDELSDESGYVEFQDISLRSTFA